MEAIKPLTHAEQILTERQLEVFLLLGKGNRPTKIGEILFLSPKTISSHRIQIMAKMGFKDTYELIHYAISCSLVSKADPDRSGQIREFKEVLS